MPDYESERTPLLRNFPLAPGSNKSPEFHGPFFSRLTFSWLNPLLTVGKKRPLNENDLFKLDPRDSAEAISSNFSFERGSSLRWALLKSCGGPWLAAAPLRILSDILRLFGPLALNRILTYLDNDGRQSFVAAVTWAIALAGAMMLQTVLMQHYYILCNRTGLRVRTAVMTAVYEKALKLSLSRTDTRTVGEMVNLLAVDCENVGPSFFVWNHWLWSGPFQVAVCLWLLYRMLGNAALTGLLLVILLLPINIYLGNRYQEMSDKLLVEKDERLRVIDGMLSVMRPIKFNGWEPLYRGKIHVARNRELGTLRSLSIVGIYLWFLWQCAPIALAACVFTYLAMDPQSAALTPATAFSALALFQIIRTPLSDIPELLADLISFIVSSTRLTEFLNSPEIKGRMQDIFLPPHVAGSIRGGNLTWNLILPSERKVGNTLNVFASIPKNALTIITGPVASGKSSFLAALLGELHYSPTVAPNQSAPAGPPVLNGDFISYASQMPFILNASIRENILFGRPYNHEEYTSVIEACCLLPDLSVFKDGDLTKIGEAGVTCSGGQRARIALARAVYSAGDVILLDDVFAAVDVSVGRVLFEKTIGSSGLLAGRTRILVTHNIDLLSQADYVVFLNDGDITKHGRLSDLAGTGFNVDRSNSKCLTLKHEPEELQSFSKNDLLSDDFKAGSDQVLTTNSCIEETGQEDREFGKVSFAVYCGYFRSMGTSLIACILLLAITAQCFSIGVDAWLSLWSDTRAKNRPDLSTVEYLVIYLMIATLALIGIFAQQILFALASIRASRELHNDMLSSVLACPVIWFDENPTGRILNRFSKDVHALDTELPQSMTYCLVTIIATVGSVLLVLYAMPAVLLPIIPISLMYFLVGQTFLASNRELKRLESISRSPILAQFAETVRGLDVIRAFGEQKQFIRDFISKVNNNTRPRWLGFINERWMSLRLEIISSFFVGFTAIAAVCSKGRIGGGLAGLALTYAIQISGEMHWLVMITTTAETHMANVERVIHYGTRLPAEREAIIPEADASLVRTGWPQCGEVIFEKVSLRYRSYLEPALRNVSFTVKAGTKLGVVGRTGAGKSSLATALFRIVELESGSIKIDGVNHSNIGLHTLRTHLGIISQDPAIIGCSTIRTNLDPLSEKSDSELWKTLEQISMKTRMALLPLGLDSPVVEGGTNFSAGERQLLCFARALLRRSPVVIMDEASSSVDWDTEAYIQEAIRQHLSHATLIIIAHRLRTVIECDNILVMEDGMIQEGPLPPALLLSNKDSRLSALINEMGGAAADELRASAERN